jgi:predicted nucleotidyltransferase
MLTTGKALDAVHFVRDALAAPESVIERADMGSIHTALAPSLDTWVTECGGPRDILMVSASGSVNYDLVTEDSDLDMKAAYLPSFADYYHSRFPKFNFVTDEFDCELHPVHHFVQFVLKGHPNHIETLYSKAKWMHSDFSYNALIILKPMVETNVMATVRTSWFSALQANDEARRTVWKNKKASHAIRFLLFLITLLDRGVFDFTPHEPLRTVIMRLKRNEMKLPEYDALFCELLDTAKEMAFKSYESNGRYEFSDRVMDLDDSKSPLWAERMDALNDGMMRMLTDTIESDYYDKLVKQGTIV